LVTAPSASLLVSTDPSASAAPLNDPGAMSAPVIVPSRMSADVIVPSRIFEDVMAPSASLGFVTEASASSLVPTASAAISDEPTAFAAISEAPTESAARLAAVRVSVPTSVPVTEPSAIFEESTAPFASLGFVTAPSASGVAVHAAMVGLARLIGYMLGWELSLDELLFRSRLDGNRMAPNTALCFILVALALMSLDVEVGSRDILDAEITAGDLLSLSGAFRMDEGHERLQGATVQLARLSTNGDGPSISANNDGSFHMENIAPELDRMKAAGVTIVQPIADRPDGVKSFFIAGPDAVSIEIVEAKPIPDGLWR